MTYFSAGLLRNSSGGNIKSIGGGEEGYSKWGFTFSHLIPSATLFWMSIDLTQGGGLGDSTLWLLSFLAAFYLFGATICLYNKGDSGRSGWASAGILVGGIGLTVGTGGGLTAVMDGTTSQQPITVCIVGFAVFGTIALTALIYSCTPRGSGTCKCMKNLFGGSKSTVV